MRSLSCLHFSKIDLLVAMLIAVLIFSYENVFVDYNRVSNSLLFLVLLAKSTLQKKLHALCATPSFLNFQSKWK